MRLNQKPPQPPKWVVRGAELHAPFCTQYRDQSASLAATISFTALGLALPPVAFIT